jgi:hypothetical protein
MFVHAPELPTVDDRLQSWADARGLPPTERARPNDRDARIHALCHVDAIGLLTDPVRLMAQRDAFILHACALAVRIGPWGWEHLGEVLARTPVPLAAAGGEDGVCELLSSWLLDAIVDDHEQYVHMLDAGHPGVLGAEASLLDAGRHQEAVTRALHPTRPLAAVIALGRWHANSPSANSVGDGWR